MRRETLHPRIEFETLAARSPRAVEYPIEECATEAMRAVVLISHKVVHVTEATQIKALPNAIACDGADVRLGLKVGKPIASLLLAPDTEHKVCLWNVRAKL